MQEKTLKEIADILGIDKQKVYRYVKRNHINEAFISASKKYYDVDAQERIKAYFTHFSASNNVQKSNSNEALYDALLKQLDIKDKQISELQKLLDHEQQLNAINQTKIAELEDKQNKQNRHFWNKWF